MNSVFFLTAVLALCASALAAPAVRDMAQPAARTNKFVKKYYKPWRPRPTPYYRPVWRDVDAELGSEEAEAVPAFVKTANTVPSSEKYYTYGAGKESSLRPAAKAWHYSPNGRRYWKPYPTPYYRPVWREVDSDLDA